MKTKHEAIFADFSKTFSVEALAKWKAEVEEWENDPSGPSDPFNDEIPGMHLNFSHSLIASSQ